jgi:hypothetical protein
MLVVEGATAATLAVDTMAGAGATTGVAGIVATLVTAAMVTATVTDVLVMDSDGASALASVGDGPTGILTATVMVTAQGATPAMIHTIALLMRLTATQVLVTATTLPRQILPRIPAITPR